MYMKNSKRPYDELLIRRWKQSKARQARLAPKSPFIKVTNVIHVDFVAKVRIYE